MVRAQIMLSEELVQRLRQMAERESVSKSEIVRRGIGALVQETAGGSRDERVRRALAAVGAFRAGTTNLSERHSGAFEGQP